MNHKTFNDITHAPLRIYNRFVLLCNLNEDFGKNAGIEYIKQFNEKERKELVEMANDIQLHGQKQVMKMVTANLVPEKEGYEHVEV